MTASLFENLTQAEYHLLPGIRKSVLWEGHKSMAHLLQATFTHREATDQMNLGSAVHCLALESHKFKDGFQCLPKVDRRTTAGKDAWAAAQASGKILLTPEQEEAATAMALELHSLDVFADLVASDGALVESSITWVDGSTAIACKVRPDLLVREGRPVILDVKTTRDARKRQFQSSVYEFGYHVQAAMYCEGVQALTGQDPVFLFACVENTPPYNAAMYYLSDRAMVAGLRIYRRLLNEYADCVESGEFPGYSSEIESLDLPAWAEL